MAGYIKGITIEIDGETKGLDAALKKVNTQTRSLQGELKRVNSLLKLNPGNTDLVRQKQKLLAQSITQTKTKLDALRQAQAKMKSKGVDETSADYRRLQREIVETSTKLKMLQVEQRKFNIESSKVGLAAAKLSAVGGKLTAAGQKMRGLTTAAGLLGGAAVMVGKQFDESMSKVQAVSGATGKDFDALRDKAREMGAKTKFSASDAAEAMNYMAMAGWKTGQMLDGIDGIMNLAAASGEDLATTSDIVTDGLTAMGYAAGDAGRLADVMAAASSNANTNVGMMGETFKYAASVAGAMGYSMEDVALATGLMANSGIKATQAGTSLRSIISRLAAPTGAVQKTMDSLGVSMTDSSGKARPFREVLVDLRKSMDGMSETEKTAAANTLAGKNAMSGFLALINASDKDFYKLADAIDNSDGAAQAMADTMMDNFGGQVTVLMSSLQELAIAVSDTLTPAVKKLTSGVQALVSWFNGLSDKQKSVVVGLAAIAAAAGPLLIAVGGMLSLTIKSVKAFAELAVAYDKAKAGAGKLGKGISALKGKYAAANQAARAEQAVIKTNTALYGANAAGIYKTTAATGKGTIATRIFTKAQMALSRVLALGPWKLIGIGVGIAVAALAIFCAANDDAREKVAAAFTKIRETVSNVVQKLPEIFKAVTSAMKETLPAMAKEVSKAIPKIADALENGMPEMLQAGIDTVLAVIDGVTESLPQLIDMGVSILINLINGLTKALPKLAKKIPQIVLSIVTAITKNLPKIIKAGITIITAIITGLTKNAAKIAAAAVVLMVALMKGMIKCIPILVKAIPQIIKALVRMILAMVAAFISAGGKLIMALWKGMNAKTAPLLTSFLTFLKKLPQKVLMLIASMLAAGGRIMASLWSGIKSKVAGITSTFTSLGNTIRAKVKAINLLGLGKTVITTLWNGLKSRVSNIVSTFTSLGNSIRNKCRNISLSGIGKTIISGLWNGIKSKVSSITGTFSSLATSIKNKCKGVSLYSIGKSIMSGLAKGIRNGASSVISAIGSALSSAIKAGKKKLGINSPSKVVRDQIGIAIPEGLALGIENGMGMVTKAAEKASVAAIPETPTISMAKVTGDISDAIGTGLAVQASGANIPSQINVVVELGGIKVGEQIVKLYDRTKRQVG